ncbi:MAG TPA: hypothetical protein DDW65_05250 [Firmicutes bacterium]|nr:hypothetical protein [Bacillota bacterium]
MELRRDFPPAHASANKNPNLIPEGNIRHTFTNLKRQVDYPIYSGKNFKNFYHEEHEGHEVF